jgi:hypothetical protein
LERAITALADAGTMFGTLPLPAEMIAIETHWADTQPGRAMHPPTSPDLEYKWLSPDDDDEGDGGIHRRREPVGV